jgi:hypothetical protein
MAIASKVTRLNSILNNINELKEEQAHAIKDKQHLFNTELFEEVEDVRATLFENYNMGLITYKEYFSQVAALYKDAENECFDIIY